MRRIDLSKEPPEIHAPSMALTSLCRARDFATDPHDQECYEMAIEYVLQVKAMREQREKALNDLADLGQEFDAS